VLWQVPLAFVVVIFRVMVKVDEGDFVLIRRHILYPELWLDHAEGC